MLYIYFIYLMHLLLYFCILLHSWYCCESGLDALNIIFITFIFLDFSIVTSLCTYFTIISSTTYGLRCTVRLGTGPFGCEDFHFWIFRRNNGCLPRPVDIYVFLYCIQLTISFYCLVKSQTFHPSW